MPYLFRALGDVNELYWYMNSGHTQTESYRTGLYGPYALWFTSGSTPGTYDTSFWGSLSISGYTALSGRGYVSGLVSEIPSAYARNTVIGWKNSNQQYWTTASSNGTFTSPAMIPGTYTMTLYKGELEVATKSVTVSAGNTNSGQNIASTETTPATVYWKFGEFDGTPAGFLNAEYACEFECGLLCSFVLRFAS